MDGFYNPKVFKNIIDMFSLCTKKPTVYLIYTDTPRIVGKYEYYHNQGFIQVVNEGGIYKQRIFTEGNDKSYETVLNEAEYGLK